uniref:F-box domain-containing protein n=1 Tax=Parascaris univalens TaxID=6257 RepID=A0A915BI41_PARUN
PIFMRMRSLLRSLRKERNAKCIEEDFNSCVPAVLLPVDLLERIFRELPAEVIPTLWDVCRSWRNAVYLRRNRLPKIRRQQIIVRYGITNDRLESELRRRSLLKEIGPLSFDIADRIESTSKKRSSKKYHSYSRYRLHYSFDVFTIHVYILNTAFRIHIALHEITATRLVLNLSYGGLDARSLAMQLPLICEDIVRNTAIHCVDLLFKRNDGVDMAWIGPLLQSKKRVAVYVIDT